MSLSLPFHKVEDEDSENKCEQRWKGLFVTVGFLWDQHRLTLLWRIFTDLTAPSKKKATAALWPHYSTSFKQVVFTVAPPPCQYDWRTSSLTKDNNSEMYAASRKMRDLECECVWMFVGGRRSLTSNKEWPPANDRRGNSPNTWTIPSLLMLARGGGSYRLWRCCCCCNWLVGGEEPPSASNSLQIDFSSSSPGYFSPFFFFFKFMLLIFSYAKHCRWC